MSVRAVYKFHTKLALLACSHSHVNVSKHSSGSSMTRGGDATVGRDPQVSVLLGRICLRETYDFTMTSDTQHTQTFTVFKTKLAILFVVVGTF